MNFFVGVKHPMQGVYSLLGIYFANLYNAYCDIARCMLLGPRRLSK
jgi:hypothetical protein